MREIADKKRANTKKKFDWKKKYGEKIKRTSVEDEEIAILKSKLQDLKSSNLEAFTKTVKTFSDFPLSTKTLKGLSDAKFETPTEIQKCSILPGLLGFDVLGGAKTGSGKTLAFVVPILEKLYKEKWSKRDGLGALIVSPTRELALQTFKVLKLVNKHHDFSVELVIGGKFLREERDRILETNIVICTPGRLQQHLETTFNFRADSLHILVLDEADRILDLGFQQQMTEIAENLPVERQTLFFSATQTRMVRDLARVSMRVPVVAFTNDLRRQISPTPLTLKQNYLVCPLSEKLNMLWSFIKNYLQSKIVVFFATCKQVRYVHEAFRRLRPGTTVLALHSKMKYTKRMSMFESFVRKQRAVLFATDIVARGLDFPDVDWVIHMDCPTDVTTYIHRSGRTARCDKQGTALLVLLPSEEHEMVRLLGEKKVPIKKIKVQRKKQFSIVKKLGSLCAADVTFKEFAQRGFVSYLKSVVMASNKKMFDVTKLDLEPYALSLGLACAPTVRFPTKRKVKVEDEKVPVASQKVKSDEDSGSEQDSSDGSDSEESGNSSDDSSADVKADCKTEDTGLGFNNEDEKDDELFVRKGCLDLEETDTSVINVDPQTSSNKSSAKNKLESKYAMAKKVLKKKLTVNSKVIFDDEGKPLTDAYRQTHDAFDAPESEPGETGGIDLNKAKSRLLKEDQFDKKLYREKIQLKHREKRLKAKDERRKKKQPETEDQNEVTDEPDLDFLPDPDKIYGRANDASDKDECGSSDGDYSLKVQNKRRHDDGGVDDGFDSCEYDNVSSDEEPKRKIQKRLKKKKQIVSQEEDKRPDKKKKKLRRTDDDNLDTGFSLMDDEAIALKLLNS